VNDHGTPFVTGSTSVGIPEDSHALVAAEPEIRGSFAFALDAFLEQILPATERCINGKRALFRFDEKHNSFTKRVSLVEQRLISTFKPGKFDQTSDEFIDNIVFWKKYCKNLAGCAFEAYNMLEGINASTDFLYYTLSTDRKSKLELINRFAKHTFSEKNLAKYIATLFPNLQFVEHAHEQEVVRSPSETASNGKTARAIEVDRIQLPSSAPALWKVDKLAGDTPPEFIKRVYAKWLGNGLTIADLRKLDPSLVRALAHHEKQGRLIPDGFDLPPGKRGPKIETGDSISPEVDDSQGVLRTYWRERQNQARAKRRDNEPDDGRGR
jgi:hypothetical protein